MGDEHLPNRTFLFVEAYCVGPNCDCRRVLVKVLDAEDHQQVATISYAFEPPQPPFDDEGQVFLDPLKSAIVDVRCATGAVPGDDRSRPRLPPAPGTAL